MTENVKNYSAVCSKIGFAMLIFYAAFTLSMVGIAFVGAYLEVFIGELVANVIIEVLSAIAYFLSFSGAAFILCRMVKELPTSRRIYTSFKLDIKIVYIVLAIIAVNFTLAYLNNVMISSLSPTFASSLETSSDMEGKPLSEVSVFFVLSIISTAIVPAICEEYLFRGAILTNLLPYGKTTAILGSAILFGLMHQNPFQLLYTTLMGVVIGYVYVKTKSIWACMIIHFANNLITVLEEYLPILTGCDWITAALDLVVMIVGAISLIIIVLKKDREPSIEENGSFGVVYEQGMDVEEYELGISQGKKVKCFFAVTVIIYAAICLFSMVQSILSIFGITIF